MRRTLTAVPLDPATADRLTRAADAARETAAERDRLIAEAIEGGASLRPVAEAVGLSRGTVANIVQRHQR